MEIIKEILDITKEILEIIKEILENIDANTKYLRSKNNSKATPHDEYFMSFSISLMESYNEDPARIQGLETYLAPYITLDPVSNRYVIDNARLTVHNEQVIKALIEENTPEDSVFKMVNEKLKTLFNRFAKKNP